MSVYETENMQPEQLSESGSRDDARLILDCLPMGIFWKNASGAYGGANQVALAHANLSSAQCLNKSDKQMPWRHNLESIQKMDQLILSADQLFEIDSMPEFYLSRSYFNYYLKMPWHKEDGTVGILGIAIHIKNIHDYQKTDEVAAEAVRRAILACSHDIRLPINAVVGNLQIARFLLRKNKVTETLQVLDKINRSIIALLAVFDQLSNSSTKNKKQRFALCTLAQNEVELAKSLINPMQEVELIYTLNASADTFIYSNLYLVSQIVRNLLSNAVRYTKKGLINFKITLLEADPQFDHLTTMSITVQDTGCGLTPEIQAQLLAPLVDQPGDDSRSTGIDIIKENVSLLQGTLAIKHTSGAGTMIVVTIPCVVS